MSANSPPGQAPRGAERNLRLGLVLASIALAVFLGFVLRRWLLA